MGMFYDDEDDNDSPTAPAAAKELQGPPTSAMSPPSVSDYLRNKYLQASDDSAVKAAQERADRAQLLAGIMQGVGQMVTAKSAARGGHSFDGSGIRNIANAQQGKVGEAERMRQSRMQGVLAEQHMQNETKKSQQADEKFGWEKKDHDDLSNAASKQSVLWSNMARSRVKNLMAEARQAGAAPEELQALQNLDTELAAGKYSAAEIGKMSLLDKVDYKDVLNNNAAMARIRAQEAGANARQKGSLDAEKRRMDSQTFGFHRQLRDSIEKDPLMREAASGRIALAKLTSAMTQNNPAGDEAMIVSWQKGLDPISVVREGEFARTTEGQGLIRRLESAYMKAAGEGRLTPEAKAEIATAAADLQRAYEPYAANKLKVIDANIKKFDLDPELIYSDFNNDVAGRTTPSAPAAAGAPAAAPVPAKGATSPAPSAPPAAPKADTSALKAKAEAILADPNAPADAKAKAKAALDKLNKGTP